MMGRVAPAILLASLGLSAQKEIMEARADSSVRVVIYEDLQCSDCAAFRAMMDEKLLPRYRDRVAFLHRDFPLAKHAWARRAAVAARYFALRHPALGLEYRRSTMAGAKSTNEQNFGERLTSFAEKHGINAAEALAALGDPQLGSLVEKDYQEGIARGVSRTPTVFVNGQPFIETFTFEEISKAMDQALAEAK
jgi:protein-disulfide isomerase